MQKCSICEKPIYGHPQVKPGQKLVCGSCPLTKSQGGPSGKSLFAVRLDLAKTVIKQHPEKQESVMNELRVKSNVRNRTILLDKYPVGFDANGEALVPLHLRELLEREMRMRPGRFTIMSDMPVQEVIPVETPDPVVVEEVPAPAPVEPEEPEITVEEEPAPAEEIPASVDQSFLTDETLKPEAKASDK